MESHIRTEGSYTIIVVTGEIDFHYSPGLRQEIMQRLKKSQNVLLDLTGVTYLDSSGIASLVEGLRSAQAKNLHFGLVGIQDTVMQVLRLTRLDRAFSIYPTVEAGKMAGG